MTNKTDWPGDTTEEAFRTGRECVKKNSIPIILGALLVGAILGAVLRPAPRKEPDPIQTVREWFEKTVEELSSKWPAAKKQARCFQDDLIDRSAGLRKKLNFWCR